MLFSSPPPRPLLTSTAAPIHWSDIPTTFLLSELRRRQEAPEKPACGTKGRHGNYNTPLHVFALVLILVLSTGGEAPSLTAFPAPFQPPTAPLPSLAPESPLTHHSLRISPPSQTLPPPPYPAPLSLPLAALRHRCPHRHRLRALAPYSVRLPHRSLSAMVLE